MKPRTALGIFGSAYEHPRLFRSKEPTADEIAAAKMAEHTRVQEMARQWNEFIAAEMRRRARAKEVMEAAKRAETETSEWDRFEGLCV